MLYEAGYEAASTPEGADCRNGQHLRVYRVGPTRVRGCNPRDGAIQNRRCSSRLSWDAWPSVSERNWRRRFRRSIAVIGLDRYGEILPTLDGMTEWSPVVVRPKHSRMDILNLTARPDSRGPLCLCQSGRGVATRRAHSAPSRPSAGSRSPVARSTSARKSPDWLQPGFRR